jgi:hypothetical protein
MSPIIAMAEHSAMHPIKPSVKKWLRICKKVFFLRIIPGRRRFSLKTTGDADNLSPGNPLIRPWSTRGDYRSLIL